jgi:hypothetical protein
VWGVGSGLWVAGIKKSTDGLIGDRAAFMPWFVQHSGRFVEDKKRTTAPRRNLGELVLF